MGFGLKQSRQELNHLRRVEAHLRPLQWSVEVQDVVIKYTQPVRVARAMAASLTHADIAAVFGRLLARVIAHLEGAGVKPGISVAAYDDDSGSVPEGEIVLHASLDIGDQDAADGPRRGLAVVCQYEPVRIAGLV
jgi:hypothetical protein